MTTHKTKPSRTTLLRCAAAFLALIALGSDRPHPSSAFAQDQVRPMMRGQSVPRLEIVGEPLDFGFIAPGAGATRSIRLINTSQDTLRIARIMPSCPCLIVRPRAEKIPSGGEVQLIVALDTPAELGPLGRSIRIFCDGYNAPFQFTVGGEVTYRVRINRGNPASIPLAKGHLTLESLDDRPFTILSFNGEPPTLIGLDEGAPPRAAYTLAYDWSALAPQDVPRWAIIETDHPGAQLIDVKVLVPGVWESWRPANRWRALDERITLGADINPDEWIPFSATLTGLPYRPDLHVEARSSNPDVEIELLEARKPDKAGGVECRLRARFRTGTRGSTQTVLTLTVGDLESGIDLFARVVE